MVIYFSVVIVYAADRPRGCAGFVNRIMRQQLIFFQ